MIGRTHVPGDLGSQAVGADHEPGTDVEQGAVRSDGADPGGAAVDGLDDDVAHGGAVEEAGRRR